MESIITINLSESRNAKIFDKSSLIHSSEFIKVQTWIDERIEQVKSSKKGKNNIPVRLHDTISILGSRGSGKTSFLCSVLDYYKQNRENEVEIIDVIDPTLIEEKGHIFLNIISQIADKVDIQLSQSSCDPESMAYQNKKDWDSKLKKLAAGLPSLDGIGSGFESWQDPEIIMHSGLKNVHSAKNLEENFHQLVKFALDKILKKEVLIIALDDIDIDFLKGWPVLETIRKYLTSPHIITLLSGDLKLFSKAIRKQQWKNFGKALMINEADKMSRMEAFDDLVTEMEGQYLQKVIQPQRRIHLTTIQEKVDTKGEKDLNIYINNEANEKIRITEFYNNILKKFGINNRSQANAYRSFLLSLPIRTQIQFLSATEEASCMKEINVTDPFLSDLYEKRVDVGTAKSTPKYLNAIILKLLINEKVLGEGYQLQPTTMDISLNSSLTSLSFIFSQKSIDNPVLIFDYFIKIGYMRNLLAILDYQEEDKTNKTASLKSPSIEGLRRHAFIDQDNILRNISCSMTAYLRATLNHMEKKKDTKSNNIDNWGGTIPLPGFAFISKKGKEESSDRIDEVFKNATLFEKQIAFIPLSVSQSSNKSSSLPTYSVYVLLAAIGDLIRQHQNVKEDLDETLAQLSQVRSYPMPNFANFSTETEELEEVFEASKVDEKGESLSKMISNWFGSYPKQPVTPYLLGKISTRFFYAIQGLEKKNPNSLGEAMHNRMIILLNSILLEDVRENIYEHLLNNSNPVDSSSIFAKNLKTVNNRLKENQGKGENLSFSRWMLSCPLFLLYLKQNDLVINDLKEYIQDKEDATKNNEVKDITNDKEVKDNKDAYTIENILNLSIYNKLSNVAVRSSTLPSFSATFPRLNKTIEIIQSYYSDPQSFIRENSFQIKERIKHEFLVVSNPSISKIKKKYNGKESWYPIP